MYICFSVCCDSLVILFHALQDTITVLPSVVSHSVFCSVFCLLAFLLFNKVFYQHLDPDPYLSSVPLARTVTEFNQQTWVQQGNFATSVRETGVWRSKPDTSGKSLVGRRQIRPASWSSSGEAWLSPSSPGCLTGSQRSRWRTT